MLNANHICYLLTEMSMLTMKNFSISLLMCKKISILSREKPFLVQPTRAIKINNICLFFWEIMCV